MPKLTLSTDIRASRERVWEVLTDFGAYDQWSPNEIVAGEAKRFGRLKVMLKRPDGSGDYSPSWAVLWVFERPSVLEYSSGNPLVFGTKRFFRLSRIDGGIRLEHGLEMSGLLSQRRFGRDPGLESLRSYYEAFGLALAKRVTGPAADSKGRNAKTSRRLSTNRKHRSF